MHLRKKIMKLLDFYKQTNNNSDKEGLHKYISNFYCEKLSPIKDKKLNILEIGIFKGDSLKLWEDYFQNSNVYGMDVANHSQYIHSNRVTQYIMDAYNESTIEFLKSQNIKFDLIIEDGPHDLESQDYTCKNYQQFLNTNGLLVIEDVKINNLDILHKNNPEFKVLNLMHIATCFMDNVILYLDKE